MTSSGIPGITADAPRYIQKSLLPDRTDAEAVAELTRCVVGHASWKVLDFFLKISGRGKS